MHAVAVVIEQPRHLALNRLELSDAGDADLVVDIDWSGISTGTERLLWSGQMPAFPGMGYPLVPGYESVGTVKQAGAESGFNEGERVFVPGAKCFGPVRGLFGGTASRVVVPGARVARLSQKLANEKATLLALAATAHHVVSGGTRLPDLIVGHGVLGRIIARIAVAMGGRPLVWEANPNRRSGGEGYEVVDPGEDAHGGYRVICDASGDGALLDTLISRLAPAGELVLAGFYGETLTFKFPPAFMREARLSIAAQWQPRDLSAVIALAESGRLSLDKLITHRDAPAQADNAYRTAFEDSSCLKMILDWRTQ